MASSSSVASSSSLVADGSELTASGATTPTIHYDGVLPLSLARMPDHTKTTVLRHGSTGSGRSSVTEIPTPSMLSPSSERGGLIRSELGLAPAGLERVPIRIAVGYFTFFACGWSDGATVLPYFMEEFNITFMTSSLLYAAATVGFIFGTFIIELLIRQLGQTNSTKSTSSWIPHHIKRLASRRAHAVAPSRHSPSQARHLSLIYASVVFALYFVVMGLRTGYPALLSAYCICAIARAIMSGSLNPYFGSVAPMHIGFSHSLWSFGTVAAPLVCQTIISKGVPWPHFYFGSLVLAGMNTLLLAVAFAPTHLEFNSERRQLTDDTSCSTPSSEKEGKADAFYPVPKPAQPANLLKRVLSHPFQWAISMFVGFTFGTETTSQGFIVTYLLGHRNANPKTAGYVSVGFYAGLMVGRFAWGSFSQIATFKQRKIAIYGCLLIALTMHLLIRFIPSVVANAVSVSMVGLAFGPLFPSAMNMLSDILPAEQHLVGMALLSAGSSFGNAILSFCAGVMLNAKGIHMLPYWNIAGTAAMIVFWIYLPSSPPRQGSRWLSKGQ
ncbi:hypothetical protein CC1G_12662 [Coprinopsis cinerea okayama7|uniref:Major facilitator superfamily (MFS) profile domain-containing protein n=1 Tax=Coprinopsis cinerea (strain Okayama-7 / 130 / ATCC MYA-4618 / FGSC 9003) TaxID=240176 RepID=A8N1D8_COPC7|nr:hypothetical protein CC1G_12662 [Coprinopsis cinerea okayama7\|eukprot:XP_001828687.2 hypothetical protein CC1G_12662 [Coprinopsis cinerea okayama7\